MQVTSLLSHQQLHDHGHDHGPESAESRLVTAMIGLVLVGNSWLVEWFIAGSGGVADASALIGALVLGFPILRTAYRDLRRGLLTINELVAIAILAAVASGDYRTAGVVAFFMLLGEIIETRTAAGARASIEALVKLTPTKARRLMALGGEEQVDAVHLRVGDRVRLYPGDNVPADGVIRVGDSTLNQATVTGESLPVDKATGDEVFAGTQNLTGLLEVQVTRVGRDTTLGRVRELILSAEQTKLPIMRIIDQYMGYYTPLVLVIAALVWAFTYDMYRVIAILVVACPCAFILATPTAMVAALAAAARLGILVKNVGDMELAARLNAFVFDKTGTLTTGQLAVARLAPVAGVSSAELLRWAAAAEQGSRHPTALAVLRLAREAEVPVPSSGSFAETAGQGVVAEVEGERMLVGRASWLRRQGVDRRELDLGGGEEEGLSVLFAARGGRALGWIGLRDQTRAESRECLAALSGLGVRRVAMVSGDRRAVAERVAAEVGCAEVAAECLPQDKVTFVRQLREAGYRVAVVGDGVNDAPALAAGDIGIAMGAAGSDVAIHSATIALMNNDLRRLPVLVRLSRAARRVINQNFLFGLGFIVGGLALASFGYLSPIVAAILHNAGSLVVVFNSARLVRQGEELHPVPGPNPTAQWAASTVGPGQVTESAGAQVSSAT